MRWFHVLGLTAFLCVQPVWAGPYASSGIPSSAPGFVGWATGVANLTRGPQDISNPASPPASFGSAAYALGPADGEFVGSGHGPGIAKVVSLGDGGHITLNFAFSIINGPGADFAVFENGFFFDGSVYGELAFVEVSSNGTDFFRFPSVSLTQTATQLGAFGGLDPTNIHNLAGQFPLYEGTPFDLQDLVGVAPLLDVNRVTDVRIVDVVGALDPLYRRLDSLGNPINDPWPTDSAGSGFELDAVGVLHQAPEPGALALFALGLAGWGVHWRRQRTVSDRS